MQQYFAKNNSLELEEGDYHHIKNVMRMKKGDLIKIVYDKTYYLCRIKSIDNFAFEVIEQGSCSDKQIEITVAFSLIKEQKLDYLLQKGTEVGIDKFIPIVTKRSVVRLDSKKEASKISRWNKICKEAAEQSFSSKIPSLTNVSNIDEIIKLDYDLKLLCSLNEKTENIKKVLQKNNKCVKILIVVGPEGGFDKEEEKKLVLNGFFSVSLGKSVLRAETAPVVAASMINYEFMR